MICINRWSGVEGSLMTYVRSAKKPDAKKVVEEFHANKFET